VLFLVQKILTKWTPSSLKHQTTHLSWSSPFESVIFVVFTWHIWLAVSNSALSSTEFEMMIPNDLYVADVLKPQKNILCCLDVPHFCWACLCFLCDTLVGFSFYFLLLDNDTFSVRIPTCDGIPILLLAIMFICVPGQALDSYFDNANYSDQVCHTWNVYNTQLKEWFM
jgi:hypothetical protein